MRKRQEMIRPVVDNESGTVRADYPYPVPPGGNRPHGVFYLPAALR